jgi:tyrosyl-tRNA synthetase
LLKGLVTESLNNLLSSIQAKFQASQEWQEITQKAYPPPAQKKKKVKNIGTGWPGHKETSVAERPKMEQVDDKLKN